ncbi:hypothetical protein SCHPADRAFT_904186 [Schizopora paradoxa]|uniref:Uncharacterized protein n=1 Tax=Schizopora paradoxa TaxID=27342 RepID=A0A0H2RNM8_9AGAM|nr:hypothetical protein SCHPADRAFT_904186 [Schizopora paradoxa]
MDSGSHHLVPMNTDFRGVEVIGNKSSSSTVSITPSTCVDPALGKELAKSIKTVSKKVDAAYSSFSTVKKIINDPSLDLCKVDEYRKEWENIEERFRDTLFDSSRVAGSAAATLFDFVSTIIPYLLSDSDMLIKQEELHSYRKNLSEGSRTAFRFSHGLREISMRASNFEKDWSQHSSSTSLELQCVIAQLEQDIRELEASLSEAEKSIMSEMKEARFSMSKQERNALIKNKKSAIRKSSLASSKQAQSEQQVTKHAGVIQDKADDLMGVWNMILENVNLIESHIKITENGKSPDLFVQRVQKLAGQYESLMVNLKSYSSATGRTGRPNLWRALITIFKI